MAVDFCAVKVSGGTQSYLFCEVNNFTNLILVSDGHGQVAAIALVSNEHVPFLERSPFQHGISGRMNALYGRIVSSFTLVDMKQVTRPSFHVYSLG